MEMLKSTYIHVFTGILLTYLANMLFAMVGPVVLGGGLDNLTIIDALFHSCNAMSWFEPGANHSKPPNSGFFYLQHQVQSKLSI